MPSRGVTRAITGWWRCWQGPARTNWRSRQGRHRIQPRSALAHVEDLPADSPTKVTTRTRFGDEEMVMPTRFNGWLVGGFLVALAVAGAIVFVSTARTA